MPADPQLTAMADTLKGLDDVISLAQSRIRIMDAVNDPNVVTARSNLANAISKRDKMLKAIQDEMNRA